ncbi:glutaminyl-peptide cyclotransferase [Prauserella marina]|uniref:glutaminyl-peptide cyclotransferase n=1 Tax=Prauserella marina TaxID=530584 RepID=UPI001FECB3E6|nr:glutaminyl-peptide cyclotransferase [Prauserella marina]
MRRTLSVIAVLTTLTACGATPSTAPGQGRGNDENDPVERLRVEVIEDLPHDSEAFTQGLEFSGETLYEGTGLLGQSTLRKGKAGAEPDVTVALPDSLFGEGITVLESTVWQLTWQDGIAIERDKDTLAEVRRVNYEGEGWGICHQAEEGRLVMSDGSATLTFRDPETFEAKGTVKVTENGAEIDQLNELECVGGTVYANVWQSDDIVRIDPATGEVTARIDASGLLEPGEAQGADVLNGIAAYPGTDQFLITGKLWPKMFRVKFVNVA